MSANKKRNDNILRPSGYTEYYLAYDLASVSESNDSNLGQKRLSAIFKEFHYTPKLSFILIKILHCFLLSAESHHFVQGKPSAFVDIS